MGSRLYVPSSDVVSNTVDGSRSTRCSMLRRRQPQPADCRFLPTGYSKLLPLTDNAERLQSTEPKLTYSTNEVACVNCAPSGRRCRASNKTAKRPDTCGPCLTHNESGCDFGDKTEVRRIHAAEQAAIKVWKKRVQ